MSAILEVAGLEVTIPVEHGRLNAVRGVDFQVEAGEILAIVGESGCGKSLTALAAMGLLPRHAQRRVETLRFCGEDLTQAGDRRMNDLRGDRMTMIFQDPMTSLNPVFRVGDQLAGVYRRHRGASRGEARRRALDLLEKVGIPAPEQRLRQYPHQLSGGLRQRVMIAMALMCEPALIIADEPTTALDVTIQSQVLLLLARLQRELGLAVVLITHDLGVVARMCDRVLVMYAGQIVESGVTRDVFRRPCHPYTQGLLRCLPEVGAGAGARLGTIPGGVPSLLGAVDGCTFADRCAHAVAACRSGEVASAPDTAGHDYRCLLPSEHLLGLYREAAR